jgi:SAM-dependent methyltransferase
MKEISASNDLERFQDGAAKYAAYVETPEGRLRLDLAFGNLQEFLPQSTQPLHALDVGGGTGVVAIRLAQLGVDVTLLDSSQQMLEFAERGVREARVADRVRLKHGAATQLANFFAGESFDAILYHNILEYVDDPSDALRAATELLRDSSSIVSVLVRQQAGEVLKAAIKDGDLGAAERNLTAEWAHESLYGGRVRLFSTESLQAMLNAASLAIIAERGVRVISDYLLQSVSRTAEYDRIFELERNLGRRPEFAAVARYTHVLAHRV